MFRQLRSRPVQLQHVRNAAVWVVAALALTLRPGPAASRDYRAAVASQESAVDSTPDDRTAWKSRRAAAGLLMAAAAACEVCGNPGAKPSSWIRRAALGTFLGTRALDARSLPGRWPYDTFIEAVLVISQMSKPGSSQSPSLPLSVARVALYLPYTQAGLSKLLHGYDAWVRRGDANHIYHSHLLASDTHPFAQERYRMPVRVLTRTIPFLELVALPLALILPGKWRILVPCCTTIFHMVIARTWNISFWQAPAMQWLLTSVEKQPDLVTILHSSRGN